MSALTAVDEIVAKKAKVVPFDAGAVIAAFKKDWNSGRFDGHEGQWAAYIGAKLMKVGPDRWQLFKTLHAKYPNAHVSLQPICEPAPIRMRSPRAPYHR